MRQVASELRQVGRPSGKETAGHIRRLIRSLRQYWPNTRISLRADGHYSTPEVIDLRDTLGVDYVFGLPKNSRLRKHVEILGATTANRYQQTLFWQGEKAAPVLGILLRGPFMGKKHRVIARIKVGPSGRDMRCIVISLTNFGSKYLYEKIYCARGQAENYIKEPLAKLRPTFSAGTAYLIGD